MKDPECRKRTREVANKRYKEDPEFREKALAKQKKRREDPEYRRRYYAATKTPTLGLFLKSMEADDAAA